MKHKKTLLPVHVQLAEKLMPYDKVLKDVIIDKLCIKQGSEDQRDKEYFVQYWQGYTWAAILGFIKDRHQPLTKRLSSFRFSQIINGSTNVANSLLLMAMAKSEEGIESLRNPDTLVEIIAEYAKGGALYVQELMDESPDYFFDPNNFISEVLER